MILDVRTSKGSAAITSDHWHVVRSHFTDLVDGKPYLREVVSEHESRAECRKAVHALWLRAKEAGTDPAVPKDEFFARPPNYKSLKRTRQRRRAKR